MEAKDLLKGMLLKEDFQARDLIKRLREQGTVPAPETILWKVQTHLAEEGSKVVSLSDTVEPLMQLLSSSRWEVRVAAVHALGALGVAKQAIIAPIVDVLRNDDQSIVRAAAAQVLGILGEHFSVKAFVMDDEALKVLEHALNDGNESVRAAATDTLLTLIEHKAREERQNGFAVGDSHLPVLDEATLVLEQALKKSDALVVRERIPLEGQIINNYQIMTKLGEGSYGRTFLAKDTRCLDDLVVIKLLHCSLDSALKQELFLQETQCLTRLQHPHILPILDFGIDHGTLYTVTKYVRNGSLRDYFERQTAGSLSLERILTILSQVGSALEYAHQHNIIHRDIKPANILLRESGEALLTDFSIPLVQEETYHERREISPHTAPEQANGTASKKSDQYALSCVAYELITGLAPFTSSPMMNVETKGDEELNLSQSNAQLPEQIKLAILKGLAMRPAERHRNIATFVEALQHQPDLQNISSVSLPSQSQEEVHPSIPPEELSDEALVNASAGGAAWAFEVLYKRYARILYTLAYHIVADHQAAEDLLQDAFLTAWRRATAYSPQGGDARRWLISIVHHRAIDYLRKVRRQSTWKEAPLEEVEQDQHAILPDVWDEAWRSVQGERVRAALMKLPREQRLTLELAYFQGWTHSEIAEVCQIPLGTVKARVRLGLAHLKRELERMGIKQE